MAAPLAPTSMAASTAAVSAATATSLAGLGALAGPAGGPGAGVDMQDIFAVSLGPTASASAAASAADQARRMSQPVISMRDTLNSDGSVPLHLRRKRRNTMSWQDSASMAALGLRDDAFAAGMLPSSVSLLDSQMLPMVDPAATQLPLDLGPVPDGQPGLSSSSSLSATSSTSSNSSLSSSTSADNFRTSSPPVAASVSNRTSLSISDVGPAAMMTTFNSKVSATAQKKHRCAVCSKRFTRPSSLQTHMYSHTGEKPFQCDYKGCGRHFSVVSNLRRHKKIHSAF
ncbi:uncharacterized protein V1510DRAFT_410961 [Dipodascopsis tothii]|uniref:uncharacterized protein n=1 Tax=Dipodascopsis tothii TaxID=44089 RepID=UPI0034CD3F23